MAVNMTCLHLNPKPWRLGDKPKLLDPHLEHEPTEKKTQIVLCFDCGATLTVALDTDGNVRVLRSRHHT